MEALGAPQFLLEIVELENPFKDQTQILVEAKI